MTKTAIKERRQGVRKSVRSGIVALQDPNRPIEIGNVIDISPDGLSCILPKEVSIDKSSHVKMDILLINDNIFLEGVSTEVISDHVVSPSPMEQNNQVVLKRLGVKFNELEPSQARQLNRLSVSAFL